MEENNKFGTNTDGSGSGSMLYGEAPQAQAAESGHSSVYGTEPQGTAPVQLAKPSEPMPQGMAPVQLTKTTGTETQPQVPPPVQLTKPAETIPQPQGQNPYGQPNQSPMGFGPMQVPPPVQGAPAAKSGKSRTGLVVGILCAAAVVIVIAAVVLLSKSLLGGDARQQLARGYANMAKEMAAYQSSFADDIGLAELSQLKDTRPIHTNIDLSFTDPNASGSFNGFDVELDTVTDYREKTAKCDLGLGTYGITMNVANIAAAENTLYVSVPILFQDEVFSLELTDLGRNFNNSAWSSLMDETIPEDYSLTLFPDTETSDEREQSNGESELWRIFLEQGRISADSIQYEIIQQKREFTIGGTSAQYGGVRVTMDKDAYNESMEAMRDEFLASEYYTDIIKSYETTYTGDFDEFRENMDMAVEMLFGLRFEQDIVMDFYLDKKGRIINISTPEDLAVFSLYTEFDSLAVDINFSGAERALDTIEGGIYVQSGDEILYMGIFRNADITEDYYSEDLTLRIQSDSSDDDITFRYTNNWGCDDHTFDMEIALEVPDSSIKFSADGAITHIVKGEGYTFRINHSAINIDGEDLLLMTGSIATEPSDETITVPKNATNILEMSESDIIDLIYEYNYSVPY